MPNRPPILALLLAALCAAAAGGCGAGTPNPSFPLTAARAEDELGAMAADPRPLPRPVVVIDGFMDVGFSSSVVAGRLRKLAVDPNRVLTVNLFWCGSFDDARAKIVREVDAAFPSADAGETRAVDVVGISMGGLAARYAALHAGPPPA
ncbi:MAG: hypothetical protein JWO31_1291, partial [Phycisphaerales bacterium]|nr:hypothetical protein [Phycisphaerales bacterium]